VEENENWLLDGYPLAVNFSKGGLGRREPWNVGKSIKIITKFRLGYSNYKKKENEKSL